MGASSATGVGHGSADKNQKGAEHLRVGAEKIVGPRIVFAGVATTNGSGACPSASPPARRGAVWLRPPRSRRRVRRALVNTNKSPKANSRPPAANICARRRWRSFMSRAVCAMWARCQSLKTKCAPLAPAACPMGAARIGSMRWCGP